MWYQVFLGAVAKVQKAPVIFFMSVCPSVRMEQLGSHGTDFHKTRYSSIFRISVEKVQVPLKSDKIKRYFTRRPMNTYDSIPLNYF